MFVITANISVGAVDEMKSALMTLGVPRMRMAAIMRVSRQLRGDGYVIVTPVDQCYRIRTGVREV